MNAATPFELKWGIRRGGWGARLWPLRCLSCDQQIGEVTASDWMYCHRRDVATCGKVGDLLRDHLCNAATPRACLARAWDSSDPRDGRWDWLARNPSSDPIWLRAMAAHPYQHYDWPLAQNPALDLLLLEEPAHAAWIGPIRRRYRREEATDDP